MTVTFLLSVQNAILESLSQSRQAERTTVRSSLGPVPGTIVTRRCSGLFCRRDQFGEESCWKRIEPHAFEKIGENDQDRLFIEASTTLNRADVLERN
jgi:hypothetical protein